MQKATKDNYNGIIMLKEKIVRQAIKASGISFTKLAKRLSISRTTLYNKLKYGIDDVMLLTIGVVINHDFRIEFPHLSYRQWYTDLQERFLSYGIQEEEREDVSVVHKAYLRVLESFLRLLYYVINIIEDHTIQDALSILKEIKTLFLQHHDAAHKHYYYEAS